MKPSIAILLFSSIVAIGCYTAPSNSGDGDNGSATDSVSQIDPSLSEYDIAIETIATSSDLGAARAADAFLRKGGLAAINSLRKHLHDDRIPSSNYLTRSVLGKPSMANHCFWLIQDIVAPETVKSDPYSALSFDEVEQWLDGRANKTFHELRLDAAATSFARAKEDFETNGGKFAQNAMESYGNRLKELETNKQ
jgi:hypothetical protein